MIKTSKAEETFKPKKATENQPKYCTHQTGSFSFSVEARVPFYNLSKNKKSSDPSTTEILEVRDGRPTCL